MLAPIFVLSTIGASTGQVSMRVFAPSWPDSSSSTAGQTVLSPSGPSSFSISYDAHANANAHAQAHVHKSAIHIPIDTSSSSDSSSRSSFGSSSTSSTYNDDPILIKLIGHPFPPRSNITNVTNIFDIYASPT